MMHSIKWVDNSSENRLNKVEKKLLHYVGKAIHDFNLIQKNDRILVCVSGGKDSYTMLNLLHKLQKRSPQKFEIAAFTLDQSQPGWDDEGLRSFYQTLNVPFEILKKDTYSIVKEKIPEGNTYCSLCSRLRRGNIYQYAKTYGY